MLFHCTVGMGFLLGPVLIRPFFPEQSLQEREELCWHNSSNPDDLDNFKIENFTVIDDIKWPYWIMSLGHCLCAFGYLIVMFLPYEMQWDMVGLWSSVLKHAAGNFEQTHTNFRGNICVQYEMQ